MHRRPRGGNHARANVVELRWRIGHKGPDRVLRHDLEGPAHKSQEQDPHHEHSQFRLG